MGDDEFDARLTVGQSRLATLAPALRAGQPWPLAERFDDSDEAAWGPPEVLAHLEEMLAYWLGETERIVDMGKRPGPFGRTASDSNRLGIIERDRTLPIRELEARVAVGIDRWRRRWPELDASTREQRGVHPIRGEMTISQIADRFVASHIEDHLDQLDVLLAGDTAPG
jgi:hypothetical protein